MNASKKIRINHRTSLRFFSFLWLMSCCILGANAQPQNQLSSQISTPHVEAELVAHAPEGVDVDAPVWVGLLLKHQPDWHSYWKNPGDSGLPTQLNWTLPAGIEAGDIAWPVPQKIRLGNLANYGYEGQVLLSAPLFVTPNFKPPVFASASSEIEIKLHATWLVCRQECIPESAEFSLKLPLRSSTALHASVFEQSRTQQPKMLAGTSQARVVDDAYLEFAVADLPEIAQGKLLDFFIETPEIIETAAELGTGWTQQWQGNIWSARLPLSPLRSTSPNTLALVLALPRATSASTAPFSPTEAWRSIAQVTTPWPAHRTNAEVSPALQAALAANATKANTAQPNASSLAVSHTFLGALLGAILGGLILNLMPCVFPILALKVLSFTQSAGQQRSHRVAGIAYTLGVVLSFLCLGALMLSLRAAGAQLGWGFQLQSPAMVAALATLFTVIGLNLAGVFEFGTFIPSRIATFQSKNPVINDFLSGVLAVAVASPCTAPFMGASLGFAIGLPANQALLIFMGIGIGMALPYLAASFIPAVAQRLPRPGAWMDHLRKFMAFPMFATVVWLIWVLGQQSGIDGAASLLAILTALSAVLWALTLQGRARAVLSILATLIFIVVMRSFGAHITTEVAPTQPIGTALKSTTTWQTWSEEQVQALITADTPVFVDFTAAWCVTCQYNKKTTLAHPEFLAAIAHKNVALLRADWTRHDPKITQALAQLGRNGVPVYVLYQKDKAPLVFSEVLNLADVKTAISAL